MKNVRLVVPLMLWLGGCALDGDGSARADVASARLPDAGAAAAPACDARMDRLAAWLAPLASHANYLLTAPSTLRLPRSGAGAEIDHAGATLDVDASGHASFDGKPLADAAAVKARLELELRVRDGDHAPVPTLYLRADARMPAATLARVVAAVPARFAVRRLVIEAPAPPMQVPAELLASPSVQSCEHQRADGASSPGLVFSLALRRGIDGPGCVAVVRYAAIPSDHRSGPEIAASFPRLIRGCRCQVPDLDLAEYALLGILGAFEPPLRSLPLPAASVWAKRRGTVGDWVATVKP